jgi:hypothetical protein
VLEDTLAKEGLISTELSASAAVDKERSAAAINELNSALAKASIELDETKQRLVEALRYHSLTCLVTASLSQAVKNKARYINVKGFALYTSHAHRHFLSQMLCGAREGCPPHSCTGTGHCKWCMFFLRETFFEAKMGVFVFCSFWSKNDQMQ